MNLEDELGITKTQITNLVRKGIISSGGLNKHKMFLFYRDKLNSGVVNAEAVKLTSDEFDVSKTYIYKIIQELS